MEIKIKRANIYVDCASIDWLKADGNYTTIYLNDNSKLVSRVSLKDLEERLPEGQFVRIHKSYILNRQIITKRTATRISIGENVFTIGRAHQKQVYAFFDQPGRTRSMLHAQQL